jgi:hypothetical protein
MTTDASTVTDTEEGRAFFQARLSIFGLCLFVLAGGSWALLWRTLAPSAAQPKPSSSASHTIALDVADRVFDGLASQPASLAAPRLGSL